MKKEAESGVAVDRGNGPLLLSFSLEYIMTALSTTVIKKFCKMCDWTFQVWQLRKHLFDESPMPQFLQDARHGDFFKRLAEVTQDYWLLQLAKLHDPPVQSGQINLSVDYIVSFGGWDDATREKLQDLRDRMADLAQKIKGARNKILSHNDLATLLDEKPLGSFAPGADELYFRSLQDFVNIVYDRTVGGPYPLDDLVSNDVQCFLSAFQKGVAQQ